MNNTEFEPPKYLTRNNRELFKEVFDEWETSLKMGMTKLERLEFMNDLLKTLRD